MGSQRFRHDWATNTLTFTLWSKWRVAHCIWQISYHAQNSKAEEEKFQKKINKLVLRRGCFSVTNSCPILCHFMDCNMPGFPVHHWFLEHAQTHVLLVIDAIQPSDLLSSPSPPAFSLSPNHCLFQWVGSLHQVAKVFKFQFQHQSFQWTPRTDL